ncbi:MAG: Fe-S protein assembly co-chaperone HscB [Polyangiaceae bacterium]
MNPFEILGIDARYDLDLRAVEKRHRELSVALHPDKFASDGASARREAIERASQVNEAWRIVRDPVRRAEALFAVAGIKVGETNEPKSDQAFLMDMMEMRETLSDARDSNDLAKIRSLADDATARESAVKQALSAMFADGHVQTDKAVLIQALPKLGELRFYRRMLEDVSVIEDGIAEALAKAADQKETRT